VSWPNVPGALAEEGNGGMVHGCKATPGCVAYIGISYLNKTKAAGLGEAQLANKSGNYELPTSSTITAEASGFIPKTPDNEAISRPIARLGGVTAVLPVAGLLGVLAVLIGEALPAIRSTGCTFSPEAGGTRGAPTALQW
jgi:ABC-type phosphate transport system substrate-binding protein